MTEVELYKPNELISAIDQIAVSRTAKHLLNFFSSTHKHRSSSIIMRDSLLKLMYQKSTVLQIYMYMTSNNFKLH